MDSFQRTTELDLFTTFAFGFHHFISVEQDFLNHLGENLGLQPSDDAGSLLPLAAISVKTNCTRRSCGAKCGYL